MSTLTIRLPDDKHARLRQLAKHREISVNKLIEELATIIIAEFDAETRFRALASKGSAKEGLAILDKLDRHSRSADSPRQAASQPPVISSKCPYQSGACTTLQNSAFLLQPLP